MQLVGVARMTAVMMDTLKSELGLAYMKAAEISGSVVGCSERTFRQWYVALEGRGTGTETMSQVMKRFRTNWWTG